MIKKLLEQLLGNMVVMLIFYGLIYLMVSFIELHVNVLKWSEFGRAMFMAGVLYINYAKTEK